jgi:hypothetical protein
VFNANFNNVSGIVHNMVASLIGVWCHFQQYVRYNMVTRKLATMLYVIADTLLNVALNTN